MIIIMFAQAGVDEANVLSFVQWGDLIRFAKLKIDCAIIKASVNMGVSEVF